MGTGGMTEDEEVEASGGTCEQSLMRGDMLLLQVSSEHGEFCSEEWDTFDL